MRQAYQVLLRLYPAPYREVFGREMTAVFEEARADCRARGPLGHVSFLLGEMTGLIAGAFSMWSGDYIARSRQKLVLSYWLSIAGGVAITVFFQGFFYKAMGHVNVSGTPDQPLPTTVPDNIAPLLWAGGVLLFLSVFSLAFVWNMRIVGNRAGRLKPIWMPGGENARVARRNRALHRNTGYARRQLHHAGRRSPLGYTIGILNLDQAE